MACHRTGIRADPSRAGGDRSVRRTAARAGPQAVVRRVAPAANLALLYAMRGRFSEARASASSLSAWPPSSTCRCSLQPLPEQSAAVELLAGNLEAAEHELRRGYRSLEEMGEKAFLSTNAAVLANVLCAQGRYDDAERYAESSREAASKDDAAAQMQWRAAKAKVLASRGQHGTAPRSRPGGGGHRREDGRAERTRRSR